MTQLLETAIAQIKELSDGEQDAIAAVIIAELESDSRWSTAFDISRDKLANLADEALAEFKASKTEPLDPEKI